MRGKMWRVIKEITGFLGVQYYLIGNAFHVEQGDAQGCRVFNEVKQAGFRVELSDGSAIGGLCRC